ncbi:alpha-ketoglutarate-dependent dioxygenase AlkB [Kriegella sp. EG-1]|nr:alpha-ketoglutarate-dependent dioxygenase AlkB [Flavobacteriaceae bacterium EG-1]
MFELKPNNLALPDSDIIYYEEFLNSTESNQFFQKLMEDVPWQQDYIKVFGKVYAQPRLTALYANNGKPYSYSNITMHPNVFSNVICTLKQKVEDLVNTEFTTCLLNLYRNGKDSNGWHSDNEKELGLNPVIASLSLGEERFFHLRHIKDKTLKRKILLKNGSLLLMKGVTQHYWQHRIAKTAKPVSERINLTFRVIK